MARSNDKELKPLYAAAERFVDSALRAEDSMFTPGRPIWTSAVIADLYQRFVERPDLTARSFEEKFQEQLAGASPEVYQLAGELLFVHLMAGRTTGAARKREIIRMVLNWSPAPVAIPAELDKALEKGLAAEGIAWRTRRPFMLAYLLELVRKWRGLNQEQQQAALADPWEFKELAFSTKMWGARSQAEILLHLVHPDSFELMMSQDHKATIADAFGQLVHEPTDDVDRRLLQIRQALTSQFGAGFNFYKPQLATQWQKTNGPWDQFVRFAKLFYQLPNFDENEREYKLRVSRKAGPVIEELLRDPGQSVDSLQRLFRDKDQNMVRWQDHEPFVDWYAKSRPSSHLALTLVTRSSDPPAHRIRQFVETLGPKVIRTPGGRTTMAAFFLFCTDPLQFPPYQVTPFDWGSQITGSQPRPADVDEGGRYEHALKFLDQLLAEAKNRSFTLRDRLDAQGVLWSLARTREKPEAMSQKDWQDFQQFKEGVPIPDDDEDDEELDGDAEPLVRNDVVGSLLLQRRNVVLYGPPGTGKTYSALKLAELWGRWQGADSVLQVTFHPTFSYEDFIEGYRPNSDGRFELRSGIFVSACEAARKELDRQFLLVIDELNRGDVARIFGELITLIEPDKRNSGAKRRLPYSQRDFWVPENLHLLGTMNTADRSISLLDIAVRRRFCFKEFRPDSMAIEASARHLQTVADLKMDMLMNAINSRLAAVGVDRDRAIGHSHFMVPRDEASPVAWLRNRLLYDIIPLVEEYCYADRSLMRRVFGELVHDDGCANRLVLEDDGRLLACLTSLASGAAGQEELNG